MTVATAYPIVIGVVCEAMADRLIACDLADRVLGERFAWFEELRRDVPGAVAGNRLYRGHRPDDAFLDWHDVPALAKHFGRRVHGHFGDKPGAPGALVSRRALLLLAQSDPPLSAAILMCDAARHPWHIGVQQAIDERRWPFVVLKGSCARGSFRCSPERGDRPL